MIASGEDLGPLRWFPFVGHEQFPPGFRLGITKSDKFSESVPKGL